MRIILGLGNPGAEYQNTRHNIGFWILDALGEKHRLILDKKEKPFKYAKGPIQGQEVVLAKPTTYMNESGLAAKALLKKFLKADGKAEEFMVVHDDIDLPLGKIQWKLGGGNAGHNGLKSVSEQIGNEYFRCRVGVGRPQGLSPAKSHVLAKFNGQEMKEAQTISQQVCEALEDFLKDEFKSVQNKWHGRDLLESK